MVQSSGKFSELVISEKDLYIGEGLRDLGFKSLGFTA